MTHNTTANLADFIAELAENFGSCIGTFWSEPKKEEVVNAVRGLEQLNNIRILTKLLGPEK